MLINITRTLTCAQMHSRRRRADDRRLFPESTEHCPNAKLGLTFTGVGVTVRFCGLDAKRMHNLTQYFPHVLGSIPNHRLNNVDPDA